MNHRTLMFIWFFCMHCCLYAQLAPGLTTDPTDTACEQLDPEIFPPQTCAAIRTYMGPSDTLGLVGVDGTFLLFSPDADGKIISREFKLPPTLRSEIAFRSVHETIGNAEFLAEGKPKSVFAAILPDGRNLWLQLREVFCYYHPQGKFVDLANQSQSCFTVSVLPDEATMEKQFEGAMLYESNYQTFVNAETAKRLDEMDRRK